MISLAIPMLLFAKLARFVVALAIGTVAHASPGVIHRNDDGRIGQAELSSSRPQTVARLSEQGNALVSAATQSAKRLSGLPGQALSLSAPVQWSSVSPRPARVRTTDVVLAPFAGRGPPYFLPTQS